MGPCLKPSLSRILFSDAPMSPRPRFLSLGWVMMWKIHDHDRPKSEKGYTYSSRTLRRKGPKKAYKCAIHSGGILNQDIIISISSYHQTKNGYLLGWREKIASTHKKSLSLSSIFSDTLLLFLSFNLVASMIEKSSK